ncbi:hypothetical protein [Maridesulfovibrio sp.]|uniref:hypothetical protein n=1 Tax=Maridesulfovibrio sp. TaxID=2795000 RepID=UPI0029C9BB44|nr:hypothetical protein [Maridesulfovibrio sp.]
MRKKYSLESWEIMDEAKSVLKDRALSKAIGLSIPQTNKYCANPECTEDTHPNPLDRTSGMIVKLCESGGAKGREVAKLALNYLACDCGFKVVDANRPKPVTDEPRAEFLEIFNRVNELQTSAQNHEDPLIVDSYASKVKDTTDAFIVRYMADYRERDGRVRFSKKTEPLSAWQRFKQWFG